MKKHFFLVLVALFAMMTTEAQMQNKSKVAVYVSGQMDDVYKNIVSSKAIAYISRSTKYVALERSDAFLNAIMKEQDYQLSGEVSNEQIVKIGAKYGAKYVAVFDANCAPDGFCLMTARLVNVETGVIVKSVDSNRVIESTSDLVGLTNNVAYRLFVTTK